MHGIILAISNDQFHWNTQPSNSVLSVNLMLQVFFWILAKVGFDSTISWLLINFFYSYSIGSIVIAESFLIVLTCASYNTVFSNSANSSHKMKISLLWKKWTESGHQFQNQGKKKHENNVTWA